MTDKITIDRAVVQQVSDWFKWFHAGNSLEAVWSSKQCSRELRAALEQRAQQSDIGWIRAIDEALVSAHIGVACAGHSYEVAKQKLNELLCWERAVALDPAVSEDALALIDKGRALAQQPAVPPGYTIARASDGDLRIYGPDGSSWLATAGEDGFYGFIHQFLSDFLNAAPEATAVQKEQS